MLLNIQSPQILKRFSRKFKAYRLKLKAKIMKNFYLENKKLHKKFDQIKNI